jgi:hypothetical protein
MNYFYPEYIHLLFDSFILIHPFIYLIHSTTTDISVTIQHLYPNQA